MTNSTIEKIQNFANFDQGWSFGEGTGFGSSILQKATQVIKTAHALGFQDTNAFPGLNGEVMVTIYLGQDYWEFTLEPDETITFVYEKNGKTVIYEKERTLQLEDLLLSSIHTQKESLWITSSTVA